MSILAWIVLGLIAGFIASKIYVGTGQGILMDIVLGIVGAVVGGYLSTCSARAASPASTSGACWWRSSAPCWCCGSITPSAAAARNISLQSSKGRCSIWRTAPSSSAPMESEAGSLLTPVSGGGSLWTAGPIVRPRACAVMRRTEMRSRSSLASAEPRLDVGDLGQLLGRELALQGIDRLCEIFGMMPALDGIFGETLHARKRLTGLRAGSSAGGAPLVASLQPRRRHGRDQRVGEVAPGIELI